MLPRTKPQQTLHGCVSEEFLKRFVPLFRSLRQINSVQEYSPIFRSRYSALRLMPEIHVPDETTCAAQYLHGLKSRVRSALAGRADVEELQFIAGVIALAEDTDKVLLSLQAYASTYSSEPQGAVTEVKEMPAKPRALQGKRKDHPASPGASPPAKQPRFQDGQRPRIPGDGKAYKISVNVQERTYPGAAFAAAKRPI